MGAVPDYLATPSLMVHCMLEQVDQTLAGDKPLPPPDSLHTDLQNQINDILSSLPNMTKVANTHDYIGNYIQ